MGSTVNVKEGKGKVVAVNILKRTYKVDIPDKGIVEVTVDEEN